MDRSKAARFSFLMVLPLILGAMATEVKDYLEMSGAERSAMDIEILPTAIGFIAALVSGVLACRWMIQLVKNSKLRYFAYYCWVVGMIGLVYTLV